MKNNRNFLWLALLILGTIWILARHNRPQPYHTDQGLIFGTIYRVNYQAEANLKAEIEAALKQFDGSLSPFNDTATITRINRGETDVALDSLFLNVFHRSREIAEETNGAFDITCAPLINAWGFGFKQGKFPDKAMVDSLLEFTDYRKVRIDSAGHIRKDDARLMLNCSAIAKGYAVDVIANLLRRHNIRNFMVDIGGEVVVSGVNAKQHLWRIGINKPVEDSLATNQELQTILSLTDAALATSGNYRNFYYRDGRKYAHTIDPRSGYPVLHNLLSATVVASDCMSADAYATAFMVVGLEEAVALCNRHPELDACFIYEDSVGTLQMHLTEGMKKYVEVK